jgi:hypothetical protein
MGSSVVTSRFSIRKDTHVNALTPTQFAGLLREGQTRQPYLIAPIFNHFQKCSIHSAMATWVHRPSATQERLVELTCEGCLPATLQITARTTTCRCGSGWPGRTITGGES